VRFQGLLGIRVIGYKRMSEMPGSCLNEQNVRPFCPTSSQIRV